MGLGNNFGKVNNAETLPTLILLCLAFSRAGDHYSVDSFIRKKLKPSSPLPTSSPEYGWPLQMIKCVFAIIYFEAGYQKLVTSGLSWALSDNLRNIFLAAEQPTGLLLSQYPILCQILASLTLLCEISAPLVLVHRLFAKMILPQLFLLHIGTILTLGSAGAFTPYLICYVFWLPFKEVLNKE